MKPFLDTITSITIIEELKKINKMHCGYTFINLSVS